VADVLEGINILYKSSNTILAPSPPRPSLKFEGVWPSHPFNRSEIQPTHQTLKERNVSFEMKIILSFSKYNF